MYLPYPVHTFIIIPAPTADTSPRNHSTHSGYIIDTDRHARWDMIHQSREEGILISDIFFAKFLRMDKMIQNIIIICYHP